MITIQCDTCGGRGCSLCGHSGSRSIQDPPSPFDWMAAGAVFGLGFVTYLVVVLIEDVASNSLVYHSVHDADKAQLFFLFIAIVSMLFWRVRGPRLWLRVVFPVLAILIAGAGFVVGGAFGGESLISSEESQLRGFFIGGIALYVFSLLMLQRSGAWRMFLLVPLSMAITLTIYIGYGISLAS